MYKRISRHPAVSRCLGYGVHKILRGIVRSHSWSVHNPPEELWKKKTPFIVAFWHNQLLIPCFFWKGDLPFFMLQSSHPDGRLIAQMVAYENIRDISGSSTRQGSAGLRKLVRALHTPGCVGITPDGPRGPRYQAKRGLAVLARLSQCPVVALAWSTVRMGQLKTWDQLRIPYPWGRGGAVVWSSPLPPPLHTRDDEGFLHALQCTLNQTLSTAEQLCTGSITS